jgi:hypothetical protein
MLAGKRKRKRRWRVIRAGFEGDGMWESARIASESDRSNHTLLTGIAIISFGHATASRQRNTNNC